MFEVWSLAVRPGTGQFITAGHDRSGEKKNIILKLSETEQLLESVTKKTPFSSGHVRIVLPPPHPARHCKTRFSGQFHKKYVFFLIIFVCISEWPSN